VARAESAKGRIGLHGVAKTHHFGPFRLMEGERQLMLGDTPLPINGRAFDVLLALVRRRGVLASRQDLMDEVWPDVAVVDNNLTTQILNLRKLLAEHDPATHYIKTDPGRGYRFVAEVTAPAEQSSAPVEPAAPRAALAPPGREPHNLPSELNSFVGRGRELADIADRLKACALLTLIGAGGVGKTRCAIRVGHAALPQYPDGVWLVDLAPMNDGGLVAEAVCRVVGAPVTGERPAAEIAAAFLRQRHLLLILDNCEHVLDAAARLASVLIKHCPGVKILATSRQSLGIDGETVFRMPSLPLPQGNGAMTARSALQSDAVRLFVDRADAAAGGYVLTDQDADAVATICRRLDGVALATELAAARLRMLKPAEIAARLEDVFRLLTGGSKTALPRQQTLRATIDWSFALLSAEEQTVLCRLAVFVDGFSMAGATAVAAGVPIAASSVFDLVQALVDKSLLNADTSGAATRYRMLETTRHYAREKLAQAASGPRYRQMAAYLAEFYARGEAIWPVTPTDAWLDEFGPEVENLRAAIDWAFGQRRGTRDFAGEPGDPALGIAMVAAAGSVAEELSLQADMKRWTEAALPHVGDDTPPARAGWVLYWVTRYQSVFGVRELSDMRKRMIDLFRAAGDKVGLSCALRTTGMAMARPEENNESALAMLQEAVALLQPRGRSKDLATALAHVGSFYYFTRNDELALHYSELALAMRRELGDRTGILASYINLGEFSFVRGDVLEAIRYARDAVAQARAARLLEILGTALSNLANYLLATNDLFGARAASLEGVGIHRALGNHDHAILCLEHLALERFLGGDIALAGRIFGYTDAHFRRTDQVRDRSEQIRYERMLREFANSSASQALAAFMTEGAAWTAEQADAAVASLRAKGRQDVLF
jgi:predicted ATPase/DNA-binding winged helix-turn-helix (wHTH) protein